MSAKRPRPAIPVLVHVDNPAEVGSVTVDTSTIEGKMDTVITNQNRIYDKIPTSGGGGSADLTTVNEKITTLATAIGPASSTSTDDNIFGHVRNLHYAVGDTTAIPTATDTSVRGLLTAAKENTAIMRNMIGTNNSATTDTSLIGAARNLVATMGKYGTQMDVDDTTIRGFLYNMRNAIGSVSSPPTTTGSTVRDLLLALNTVAGTLSSSSKDTDLIGCVRNLRVAVGVSGDQLSLNDTNIRAILYNLRTAIGSGSATPTLTGTSVRDLLTQIKENTASGGGGGSADLTTVNEKTTALAAAIGSASDDSSTVSVIGLLKSITDKY